MLYPTTFRCQPTIGQDPGTGDVYRRFLSDQEKNKYEIVGLIMAVLIILACVLDAWGSRGALAGNTEVRGGSQSMAVGLNLETHAKVSLHFEKILVFFLTKCRIF